MGKKSVWKHKTQYMMQFKNNCYNGKPQTYTQVGRTAQWIPRSPLLADIVHHHLQFFPPSQIILKQIPYTFEYISLKVKKRLFWHKHTTTIIPKNENYSLIWLNIQFFQCSNCLIIIKTVLEFVCNWLIWALYPFIYRFFSISFSYSLLVYF